LTAQGNGSPLPFISAGFLATKIFSEMIRTYAKGEPGATARGRKTTRLRDHDRHNLKVEK
jgi:hypothetical protein